MATTAKINIIRKVEVTEGGGHHGGAWKVAYADFMTAMMAFFLLLWILSSADERKLAGIAEYFSNATMPNGSGVLDGATFGPPGTLNASAGTIVARGSEMGKIDDPTPAQWEVMDTTPTADPEEVVPGTMKGKHDNPAGGAASETYRTETPDQGDAAMSAAGSAEIAAQDAADALHAADVARFDQLQANIMQAMQDNPDLRPLEQNVIFERTPEGMRIQVVDQEGRPMFASGSAQLAGAARTLMEQLGQSLADLPNQMVISGHTDAVPFTNRKAYDNWDLSTDRANAMRRVLLKSGVEQARITRVSGMADTEPLLPEAPLDPSNRRITVLLEYQSGPAADAAPAPVHDAPASSSVVPASAPASDHGQAGAERSESDHASAEQPDTGKRITLLDEKVFDNLRSALR